MNDKGKPRDMLLAEVANLRAQIQELKLYKRVLDQLPVCTILYDASETVIYRNRASKAIDGYECHELLGLSRGEYLEKLQIQPGQTVKMRPGRKNDTHFRKNIYGINETTLRTKNGFIKDVLLTGDFIYDDDQNLIGACGCAVDITEHALRDKRYELMAQNTKDVVFRHRVFPTFQFEYISPASTVITGYHPEEFYENPYLALLCVHPEDRPLIEAQLQSPKPLSETVRIIKKDGGERWVEVKNVVLNDESGNIMVEGIMSDVTERVAAERELRENLHFLQTLIDTIPNPVYYKDNKGIFKGCNVAFEKEMGFIKEEILGKSIYDLRPKDLADMYTEKDLQLLSGPGVQVFETVIPYADGTMHDVILYKGTLTDNNGRATGLVGTIVDITDSKQMQKALSESEDLYRRLVELSPEAIAVHDYAGRILFVNQAGVELVKAGSSEEITGKSIIEFLHPDYSVTITDKINRMYEENEPVQWFEQTFITRDGTPVEVEASGVPLFFRGSPAVLVMARDISERKQWEKELFRLDRLNLIGQMAAGIGHEVRNPMTTVRGFLQMFQEKNEFLPHASYLNLMIEELDRANSIISQFLSLAKDKPVDKKVQNLNPIVQAIAPMIEANAFKNDIFLKLKLGDIPDLLLDEKEMRQLILNLCYNGLEAMLPGGTLSILTYVEGRDVVLSVADEGNGMQPETVEKLGTPFFTTKDEGTGLGLAVCYSIAARHKASIDAKSTAAGTVFFVRFKLNPLGNAWL